jgi:hypothetical protein
MVRYQESNCTFSFKENIKCYNFDSQEGSIFQENDFCGNKPIDFLFIYNNEIYFMEVKDIDYFKEYFEEENSNKRGSVFDKQICEIYSKYIDSYTILSLSKNRDVEEYQEVLFNVNVPKVILFIVAELSKEDLLLFLEKLEKKFKKKFKHLKVNSIFVESLFSYNKVLYEVTRND